MLLSKVGDIFGVWLGMLAPNVCVAMLYWFLPCLLGLPQCLWCLRCSTRSLRRWPCMTALFVLENDPDVVFVTDLDGISECSFDVFSRLFCHDSLAWSSCHEDGFHEVLQRLIAAYCVCWIVGGCSCCFLRSCLWLFRLLSSVSLVHVIA